MREERREKRENVKYAGFPLKQHVPQSLIISWRKALDRGITRGINTADFPLSPRSITWNTQRLLRLPHSLIPK